MLLSTARSINGGDTNPLGGIRVAALGNIALVEGTTPRTIVVGVNPGGNQGPRAVEEFDVKYRVIPSTYEVERAELQLWIDQALYQRIPVQVTDGRGQVARPFGYEIPQVGGKLSTLRLVVNPDDASTRLVSPVRRWRIEQPEVEFAFGDRDIDEDSPLDPKEEEVTADHPYLGVEVASPEWTERFSELPAGERGETRKVSWETRAAPASTSAGETLSEDGFFETVMDAKTAPGLNRSVVARIGGIVVGTTSEVVVEPGAAAQIAVTAERSWVPADFTSTVAIEAEVKDAAGNLVPDGTVVTWEKAEGTDGELVETGHTVQGGWVRGRYKAGGRPGTTNTVRVRADRAVGWVSILQAGVGIQFTSAPVEKQYYDRTPVELTVRVTSVGQPVPDGAPLAWFSTVGWIEVTQPLTDGEAKALWHFGRVTHRPRVIFKAMLGQAESLHRLTWIGPASFPLAPGKQHAAARAPGEAPVVSITPAVIAGDATADQEVPIELSDGSFENVPVKATATYRVAGLRPGERVTARLGTSVSPNVVPIAHLAGETIEEEWVPDLTGTHPGHVTGGVTVEAGGYEGDGLRFDGTGSLRVPHHVDFAFPGEFLVQAAVKLPMGSGGQTLLSKAGDYTLAVVQDGPELRARFTVATAAGEESVTSLAPVPAGSWTLLTGRYQQGKLWIGVDLTNESIPIASAPVHAQEDLVAGAGLTGSLDEIKLVDLGKPPLSTFANGAQSITFVADATGVFETEIVSTGQLAQDPAVAGYYARVTEGRAAEEPPPSVLGEYAGFIGTSAETFYEDYAESETSPIKLGLLIELGITVKFVRGLFLGAQGEYDPAVVAGDMLGGFGFWRDFINNTGHAIDAQITGPESLDLAVSSLILVEKGLGKRVAVFRGARNLARAVTRGAPGSRALARLIALEGRVSAGAAQVSRIRKLLAMAQAGTGAAALIASLVEYTGEDVEAAEHLSNTLENAEVPEEALAELATLREENTPDEVQALLRAVGTPLPEETTLSLRTGGVAAGRAPAPRRFLRLTKQALGGLKLGPKLMKKAGSFDRYAKTIANNIKHRHPSDFKEIWSKLDDLAKRVAKVDPKTGREINGNLHRLMRDLASPHPNRRAAALLVLRTTHALQDQSGIILEHYQRVYTKAGKLIKRYPDATVGQLWVECKAWSNWGSFPPPLGSRRGSYVRTAERQLLVAILAKGADARAGYRTVFPLDGIGACCRTQVVEHFQKFMKGKGTIAWILKHVEGITTTAEAKALANQIRQAIPTMILFN